MLVSYGIGSYFNGDRYKGNFKDGRPCGLGKMIYSFSIKSTTNKDLEDASYIGNWKAGKRDGYGEMTWSDNSVFKGTWLND